MYFIPNSYDFNVFKEHTEKCKNDPERGNYELEVVMTRLDGSPYYYCSGCNHVFYLSPRARGTVRLSIIDAESENKVIDEFKEKIANIGFKTKW